MKQRYASLQRLAYETIGCQDERTFTEPPPPGALSGRMDSHSHLPPPPSSISSRNSYIDQREIFNIIPTSSCSSTISHNSQQYASNLSRSYVKPIEETSSSTIPTRLETSPQPSHTTHSAISHSIYPPLKNSTACKVMAHGRTSTTSLHQSQVPASEKIKAFEKIAASVDQLADCVTDYLLITSSPAHLSKQQQQQQQLSHSNSTSRSRTANHDSNPNLLQRSLSPYSSSKSEESMTAFKNLIHATVGNFLVETASISCPSETRETEDGYGSTSSRTLTTKHTIHQQSTKNMLTEYQYQSTRSDEYSSEIDRLQDYIRELEHARDSDFLLQKLQEDRVEFESIKADLAEYVKQFKLTFLRVQLRSVKAIDIVQSDLFNEFYDILTTTELNWSAVSQPSSSLLANRSNHPAWCMKFTDDTRLLNIQWHRSRAPPASATVQASTLKKRSRSCIPTILDSSSTVTPATHQAIEPTQSQRTNSTVSITHAYGEAILAKNAQIESLKAEKEIEFSIFHTFLRQYTTQTRSNLFEDYFEGVNEFQHIEEQGENQTHDSPHEHRHPPTNACVHAQDMFDEIDSQASPSKIEIGLFTKNNHTNMNNLNRFDHLQQRAFTLNNQEDQTYFQDDDMHNLPPQFKNMMEFTIGNEPSELFLNQDPSHIQQSQHHYQLSSQNRSFFTSLQQQQHNRSFNQDIANISCINRVDDGGDAQQAISFLDTLDNKPTSRFMCQSSFKKNHFNPINWQSNFQTPLTAAPTAAVTITSALPGTVLDIDDATEQICTPTAQSRNPNSPSHSNLLGSVGHLKQKLAEEFNRQHGASQSQQLLRSKNVPVHMSFDQNCPDNNNMVASNNYPLPKSQQQSSQLKSTLTLNQKHLESFCCDEEKSRLECFMNEHFDEVNNSLNLDQIDDFDASIEFSQDVVIASKMKSHQQQSQNPKSSAHPKDKTKLSNRNRIIDLPKLDLSTINCTDTLKNARGSNRSLVHPNSCSNHNNSSSNTQQPNSNKDQAKPLLNFQLQNPNLPPLPPIQGVNTLLAQISPIHRVNFISATPTTNNMRQNESILSYGGNTQLDLLRVLNETAGLNQDSCIVDGVQGEVLLKGICLNLERENRFLNEENSRLQRAIEAERLHWQEESMRIGFELSALETKKEKFKQAKEELDARKKQHEETEKLVGQQQLMIVLQEKKILCSKQQLELQWSELEKKRDEVERTEKMVSDEWENLRKQATHMQEFIGKQKAMKDLLSKEIHASKQAVALELEEASSKSRMLRKKELSLDAYEKSLSEREARHKHDIAEEKALLAEEELRFQESKEKFERSQSELEFKCETEIREMQKQLTLCQQMTKQEATQHAIDSKRLKQIEANLEKREKDLAMKHTLFLQEKMAYSEKQSKIATDSKRMKDLLPSLKNLATKMAGEDKDREITKENDVENGILRTRPKRFSQYL